LEIHGDTSGLSPSERKALERLYQRRVPLDQLTTPELTRSLSEVSHATRRQVGVLIQRSGQIEHVVIGDAAKLMLPDLGRMRAGSGRFRGLRLVHTHLRSEPLTRDDLVDLTRLRLDLVAALCLSPEGTPRSLYYAHCVPVAPDSKDEPFHSFGPIPIGQLDVDAARLIGALEEEFARAQRLRTVEAKDGRAILAHVCDRRGASRARESLAELRELARTAGVEVADTVLQVRDQVDPRYVMGKGRLEETVLRAMQLDVDVLILDRNLTPAQAAAISSLTDLKVLDRTQLILDIFAQRAQSLDGKLQVELAQTKYLLPRLGTRDDSLSRLTGGIGGRGPGETKLEVGKRRARERIGRLEARIEQIARQREQRRARRTRQGAPVVAIVGYTNAGKSTLLNTLTGSDVLAEDKLFATLDTRSRRCRLERGEIVITDTVGFIRDLPEDLFNAFRATFEEAATADLLLQVVDGSDPAFEEHLATTEKLLEKLDLAQMPRQRVFNKRDRMDAEQADNLAMRHDALSLSATDAASLLRLYAELQKLADAHAAEDEDEHQHAHEYQRTQGNAADTRVGEIPREDV
jgi:GTP-binding protein HflX